MPIPFQDENESEILGSAAYLKIAAYSSGYRGALFLINSRGEPIEFTYTRVPIPHAFLWRQGDIKLQAARKIIASLLTTCPHIPKLILCLTEEISSNIFCSDIRVSFPVCRIALESNGAIYAPQEIRQEINQTHQSLQLFWFPAPPSPGSTEYRLFQKLASDGLLLEPFERAVIGLQEVYK